MEYINYLKSNNFFYPIIIILLSLISSSFFAFIIDNPIIYDAVEYDRIAVNINKGYFSRDAYEPYSATMNRAPLYPLFLSIIYKTFGHNYNIVFFFQILLFSLTCLFTYLISKELFGEKIASLSGILIAIYPTLASYPGYILSETLFSFLLIVSIFLLTKSFKLKKISIFFYSGIFLGLVSITKVIGLLFILFVIISLIIQRKLFKNNLFKNILVLIIGYIIVISPWSLRNYKTFDTFQISMKGGHALWMAADQLDYSKEQILQSIVFNFSETLGTRLFPDAIKDILKKNPELINHISEAKPYRFILLRNLKSGLKEIQLRKLGFQSPESIENKMKEEAIIKILDKPFIFTLQRLLEFEKMLAFSYIPALNQVNVIKFFYQYNNGDIFLSLLKAPIRLMGYLIFFLSIYGIIKTKHKFIDYQFLVLIIVYINLVYSLLFSVGRYAVPLFPYYLIFTSCALVQGNILTNVKKTIKKLFLKSN